MTTWKGSIMVIMTQVNQMFLPGKRRRAKPKAMMADDTLKVAYYDYSFTYGGKIGNQKVPAKQAFATVTPDGRVLTYSADRRDLHKATGLVLPGYQELLDSFKEDTKD